MTGAAAGSGDPVTVDHADHLVGIVPAGFEALFRANYRRLVRSLSPVSDDAADAVQEAFVEAIQHWEGVVTCDDPVAWLRRVAVNKLRDHGRRAQRQQRIRAKLQRVRPPVQASGDPSDVTAVIRQLPMRQRLSMTLFYLDDLSVEDVASAMAITVGAVKVSLHSGRKRMRTILEVHDERN
jgi:RNA polymerase sigma-70 factor (ECF subfamily)